MNCRSVTLVTVYLHNASNFITIIQLLTPQLKMDIRVATERQPRDILGPKVREAVLYI